MAQPTNIYKTRLIFKPTGREIANKAHTSFEGIVEGIKNIANEVDVVSSSAEEIAASFDDVELLSK